MRFVKGLFACLFFLWGCHHDPANLATASSTITGQVTSICPGESLVVGASISTIPSTNIVKTDAEGRFSLDNIIPGQYVIEIPKQYLSGSDSIFVGPSYSDTILAEAGRIATVNLQSSCAEKTACCTHTNGK